RGARADEVQATSHQAALKSPRVPGVGAKGGRAEAAYGRASVTDLTLWAPLAQRVRRQEPPGTLASVRSLAPAQNAQRLGGRKLREPARREGEAIDLDRRLSAVGGIREEVVDRQDPSAGDERRPRLVVAVRGRVAVSAVDEDHAERNPPQAR